MNQFKIKQMNINLPNIFKSYQTQLEINKQNRTNQTNEKFRWTRLNEPIQN